MESSSKKRFWDLKPYWCQPWSIITFGILVIVFSWILFHNLIITSILFILVTLWWLIFLIIAPNSYDTMSDKK